MEDTCEHEWKTNSVFSSCAKCGVMWEDICLTCGKRSDEPFSKGGGYYFYGGHRMHASCKEPHELIQEQKVRVAELEQKLKASLDEQVRLEIDRDAWKAAFTCMKPAPKQHDWFTHCEGITCRNCDATISDYEKKERYLTIWNSECHPKGEPPAPNPRRVDNSHKREVISSVPVPPGGGTAGFLTDDVGPISKHAPVGPVDANAPMIIRQPAQKAGRPPPRGGILDSIQRTFEQAQTLAASTPAPNSPAPAGAQESGGLLARSVIAGDGTAGKPLTAEAEAKMMAMDQLIEAYNNPNKSIGQVVDLLMKFVEKFKAK